MIHEIWENEKVFIPNSQLENDSKGRMKGNTTVMLMLANAVLPFILFLLLPSHYFNLGPIKNRTNRLQIYCSCLVFLIQRLQTKPPLYSQQASLGNLLAQVRNIEPKFNKLRERKKIRTRSPNLFVILFQDTK